MVRIDRVVTVLALGICVVGAIIAMDVTASARATPAHRTAKPAAASVEDRRALRSLVDSSNRLTGEIRHARVEAARVLGPSFASLARAQASLSLQGAQLALERAQINAEASQIAARAAALAAESAALQREAAALQARGTAQGQPAHRGQPGDN